MKRLKDWLDQPATNGAAFLGGILGATVALVVLAATAHAYVAPEKQDDLARFNWSEQVSGTEEQLLTEYAGDRHCERGRIRSALNDQRGDAMVMGWTSIGACVTRSGQLRILGVGYGQGSSGKGWRRTSPLRYPYLRNGWKPADAWHTQYRSNMTVLYEYGVWDVPWKLHLELVAIARSVRNIVFVRRARWS